MTKLHVTLFIVFIVGQLIIDVCILLAGEKMLRLLTDLQGWVLKLAGHECKKS